MESFKRVKRAGSPLDSGPLVSIREKNIGFNSVFANQARLDEYPYVVFDTNDTERIIAFEFLKDATDEDAFRVTQDGGTRSNAKACQATQLILKPWVAAVTRLSPANRRFEPKPAGGANRWQIRLMPSFELSAASANDIPTGLEGIYRYIDSHGDVIYIGRGASRPRAKEPARKAWLIEQIQYSVIPTKDRQEEWETFWLDRHFSEHGALPAHNKVFGAASANE